MVWRDERDTEACARQLAAALAPAGDALIELRGNLGAGKTTFARHLLRALGVAGRIKSPTYAVVETYALDTPLAIAHFDFYRFNDPEEWEEAGFRELFAAPGLKLVEWPDKAGDRLPRADLVMDIRSLAGEGQDADGPRQVDLRSGSARGDALVRAVAGAGA